MIMTMMTSFQEYLRRKQKPPKEETLLKQTFPLTEQAYILSVQSGLLWRSDRL